MTQENKELLLKDLCARLPYGVKVCIPDLFDSTKNNIEVLKEIFCGDDGEFRCNDSGMLIKHVKPYLSPLSSMTDEQKEEYRKCVYSWDMIDFYNKHHIDYRELMPRNLAIDATGKGVY